MVVVVVVAGKTQLSNENNTLVSYATTVTPG